MNNLLWLIPAFPLASFLILALTGKRMPPSWVAIIGAGSVSLSAIVTIGTGISFLLLPPVTGNYSQTLWTWMEVAGFNPKVTLFLDALSLVFVFVITFVGALIHIYSVAFMVYDKDYSRFFACMNLFVFAMLLLVLADNLLLLYLGWEGVGLCSYLLIGFWYENPGNGYAARKAFIITRIGDTAMAIGLFVIFYQFGTLLIPDILANAPIVWKSGTAMATITALLLLAGGVGKSAQLPLQTWLPDAMAGPSPVSALIHAATMVTAGVYLIARMHVIFQLSPIAQMTIAIIGAATLLIAGFSALTQYDIKRVLAYSTISQIGYMFLALGLGAWTAAIFHFMVHAFFKALLFLAAGAVIEALHHEHNMFRMGGLKNKLPLIFWTFLIGSASLAALPLVSAGFYSKDQILWYAWSSQNGNPLLWLTALTGAFITAAYTTRMMILTFWGEMKTAPGQQPGKLMTVPLVILAFLSIFAGFLELPHNFGPFSPFSDLLHQVLPETSLKSGISGELLFQLLAFLATFSGIYIAYIFWYKQPQRIEKLKQSETMMRLYRFWLSGWGFDKLYHLAFVRPVIFIANINKNDVVDKIYQGITLMTVYLYRILSFTQSGSLRWYIMGLVIGAIIILGIQIML
ncbi:NADH-quinone oxidoreductase subunit L [Pedobacter steynii]|uniref:NADH-quinone oxidoreductase subunit L n=1 Tax=Pedobacter steynii TaxID=430522 RepID=A0A1H0HN39_9SPHI|nr:NADH-quinone oxidoreductase subunit L [Pedobacter steynii]NQX42562.1 NADH-quinone oxidoreductase subunit L [Pedobacter steynii]SDO20537.1 NADH-quinone oxidoreductase subunit L [Pedobacter steynii]